MFRSSSPLISRCFQQVDIGLPLVASGLVSAGLAVHAGHSRHATACDSENSEAVSYYGAYKGDRFGGGIGRRLGIDESGKRELKGTGVARIALFAESRRKLREWATQDNWRSATQIHKAAYFTRTENLVQEEVLQRIREHYTASPEYLDHKSIQFGLFRLADTSEFKGRCDSTAIKRIPAIVFGKFDESTERCIVDFANKRLGGGWLSYGMVQEEKMFIERFDYGAVCAKSLVDMEIDPREQPVASPFSMHSDEAWVLRGGLQYADLGWYGRTPKNAMELVQFMNPVDDESSAPTIVAIDAIKADFPTYRVEHLEMMLVKAYVGFVAASSDEDLGGEKLISTGSWGCGAFFNNERVMFVVQTLAASLAGVELQYHVLGDGFRLGEAFQFLEDAMLRKLNVTQALHELANRCATDPSWASKFKPRSKM